MNRRRSFLRVASLFLVLVSLFPFTALAEEPSGANDRTIYIPYKELEKVFEKEGEGVFLPWAEFQRLWNAANAQTPTPDQPKPPVAYTIAAGSYDGAVDGAVATFEAFYEIEVYTPNWTQVALPLSGLALTDWTIVGPDSDRATILSANNQYRFLAPSKGHYRVTLSFVTAVATSPGHRQLSFRCPKSPVSRLEITIPDPEAKVSVYPALAVTTQTGSGQVTVQAFVGVTNAITVSWEPKPVKTVVREAVYFVERFDRFHLEEGLLRLDAGFRVTVAQGGLDAIRIPIPKGLQILSLPDRRGARWEQGPATVDGVDYPDMLTVTFSEPLTGGNHLFVLNGVVDLKDGAVSVDLPELYVLNAHRETGTMLISGDPEQVKLGDKSGVVQLNPGEAEAIGKPFSIGARGGNLFAFRYLKHPASVTLALAKLRSKLTARNTLLVSVRKDRLTIDQRVTLTVKKVGTFVFRLFLPEGVILDAITQNESAIDSYSTQPVDGGSELTFVTQKKILGTFHISIRYKAPFDLAGFDTGEKPAFALPVILVVGADLEQGTLGVAGVTALELKTDDASVVALEPISLLVAQGRGLPPNNQLGQSAQFAFAYDLLNTTVNKPAATIAVTERRSRVTAEVRTAVAVETGTVRLYSRIDFNTQYAPSHAFYIAIPVDLEENRVSIHSSNALISKEVDIAGYRIHKINVQTPVLGKHSVVVQYQRPLDEQLLRKGVQVAIPDIKAHHVAHQTRYLQIHKDEHVELKRSKDSDNEALETVDPSELKNMPSMISKPYLAIRYTRHQKPVSLLVHAQSHEYEKPKDLILTAVHATSIISLDLGVQTDVTYRLKNKTNQYMKVSLPIGSELRGLTVNGMEEQATIETADSGAAIRMIKLPETKHNEEIVIVLTYRYSLSDGEPMPSSGALSLALPTLSGLPANGVQWTLYLPEDRLYHTVEGDLSPRDIHFSPTRIWKAVGTQFKDLSTVSVGPITQTNSESGNIQYRTLILARTLGADGSVSIAYISPTRLVLFYTLAAVLVGALGLALTRLGKVRWAPFSLTLLLACTMASAIASLPIFAFAAGAFVAAAAIGVLGLTRWLVTGLLAEAVLLAHSSNTPATAPPTPPSPSPSAEAPPTIPETVDPPAEEQGGGDDE